MALISISDLTVKFTGSQQNAVNNCSLVLNANNIHCLIGQSGSGKSTIGLAILNLLEQAKISGCIFFKNINLLNLPSENITSIRGKDIAMIFQEPRQASNPLHRVQNMFANVARAHNPLIAKQEIHRKSCELLLDVGLEIKHLEYFPHQMSGGQLQRVMIALALFHNPALLIADEPTTALDTVTQKQILDLIKKLQKQYKMSILFITHDINIVRYMADEIHVIRQGIIVDNGTFDRLNVSVNSYTKLLLKQAAVPILKKHCLRL